MLASQLLLIIAGCLGNEGSALDPPADTNEGAPRTIALGQSVSDTITGTEPECLFTTLDGGWGGVCHAFDITAPTSGILETTVRWSADATLVVFMKTAGREQLDMTCCRSRTTTLRVPVEAELRYRIEVAYIGRPAGYPRIPPVPYVLEARLVPPDARERVTLRSFLIADETRTQRLSSGRIEVIEGPFAGTAAVFDSTTGTYGLTGLPHGYVRIRASAELFEAVTMRVPAGVNVTQEIVLRRLVPLPDARHGLGGMTWASANAAYTGVKVEILDGPHAGAFTFSDEHFGMYYIGGLSPGFMRVRASIAGREPQTLGVTVSGSTRLDFRW